MSTFALVLQFIPLLLDLVLSAEKLYRESQAGDVKKATVLAGVAAGVETAEALGAKVSPQSKEQLAAVAGKTVDVFVDVFNRRGWPNAVTPPGNA